MCLLHTKRSILQIGQWAMGLLFATHACCSSCNSPVRYNRTIIHSIICIYHSSASIARYFLVNYTLNKLLPICSLWSISSIPQNLVVRNFLRRLFIDLSEQRLYNRACICAWNYAVHSVIFAQKVYCLRICGDLCLPGFCSSRINAYEIDHSRTCLFCCHKYS